MALNGHSESAYCINLTSADAIREKSRKRRVSKEADSFIQEVKDETRKARTFSARSEAG